MLRLVIGGVALATVSYALCGDGCDYFSSGSKKRNRYDEEDEQNDVNENENEKKIKNSNMAKEFHKYKKYIYKKSMEELDDFLIEYEVQDSDIATDTELEKQKFSNEQISEELESYVTQITDTLEMLSQNLSTHLKMLENKTEVDDDTIKKIVDISKNIYALSHLELFVNKQDVYGSVLSAGMAFTAETSKTLNKLEILSTLVEAMALNKNKDKLHVDLSVV
jgi:hypothetical protein